MPEFGQVLPRDPHNESLVANVRPPAWANPEPAPRYNLVVLGAGSAGLVTALGAAGLGAIAAVIHPYPTQAEGIKRAADAYSRTRLTPFLKSVFERLMAWRR
jgi:hypothetical protein